jgi:uncharacterized membrane protein
MSINKTDDAVSEYLREIEVRLGNLPLLQRRELLADLEAHIAAERAERNVQSEGEVLEILERLGSPEVVAQAAYEEAGPPAPNAPLPRIALAPIARRHWAWPVVIGATAVVLVLLFVLSTLFIFSRSSSSDEAPSQVRINAPR